MNKHSFIRGAAILGIAGILVKILGAIYQIPINNMLTGTGMAYYSPAYYAYTIFVVIATSGIPVAISRMVSERIIIQNYEGAHRVFHISFRLMLGIGIVAFLIMFFGADIIAGIAQVPESALAMRTIAPALIVVPVMASFRGYYQGQQNMKPTALSQIVEQVFRVGFGLLLAYLLLHDAPGTGLFSSYSPLEKGAAGGASGATIGSLAGLVVIIFVYILSRKSIKKRVRSSKIKGHENNKEILRKILIISIPITVGACIAPIMSFLDSPLVVGRLTEAGVAHAVAKNLYGQIGGYVMPLVNLPQALSMALSMSLVPMISSAHRTADHESLQSNTSLAVRIAVMIGMPCAVGMAVLAEPILLLLYSGSAKSIAESINVAPTFALMALSIVFVSIVQTVSGILQGVGRQMIPVRNMLIGIAVKIIATWILVGIPSLNIKGAAIGTLITYVVVAYLDMHATKKYTGATFHIGLTCVRPAVATAVMGAVAWVVYYVVCGGGQGNKIGCLIAILAAAIVYVVMLFVTRSINRKDLESFSAGQKMLHALERMRIRI